MGMLLLLHDINGNKPLLRGSIPTLFTYTPQPLYNTIVGVHSINRVSSTTVLYTNKKCIDYIEK